MKKLLLFFIGGMLLSFLVTTAVRYFTVRAADSVHYHADFLISINGEIRKLDDPKFYEESSAPCTIESHKTPLERAHLHDNVSTVVHVEDYAVTWGHLFQNIGYSVNPNSIVDDKGAIYLANDEKKIRFILNGTAIESIENTIIQSKDRLLINYGTEGEQELISGKFTQVTSLADKYNTTPDPESCSGNRKYTFKERMKKALIN